MELTYTADIEEDSDGNLMIVFPQRLLEDQGWKEGDTLKWVDNEDGTWSIVKVNDRSSN
jgi:bifunctional DNA-binding transcriptional regulator/antitoxin component of YhaV-PrlF toxin-antitoxin module